MNLKSKFIVGLVVLTLLVHTVAALKIEGPYTKEEIKGKHPGFSCKNEICVKVKIEGWDLLVQGLDESSNPIDGEIATKRVGSGSKGKWYIVLDRKPDVKKYKVTVPGETGPVTQIVEVNEASPAASRSPSDGPSTAESSPATSSASGAIKDVQIASGSKAVAREFASGQPAKVRVILNKDELSDEKTYLVTAEFSGKEEDHFGARKEVVIKNYRIYRDKFVVLSGGETVDARELHGFAGKTLKGAKLESYSSGGSMTTQPTSLVNVGGGEVRWDLAMPFNNDQYTDIKFKVKLLDSSSKQVGSAVIPISINIDMASGKSRILERSGADGYILRLVLNQGLPEPIAIRNKRYKATLTSMHYKSTLLSGFSFGRQYAVRFFELTPDGKTISIDCGPRPIEEVIVGFDSPGTCDDKTNGFYARVSTISTKDLICRGVTWNGYCTYAEVSVKVQG